MQFKKLKQARRLKFWIKMRKAKIYDLEKKLITLRKINCSSDLKNQLRKAAKDWIDILKFEVSGEKGKIGDYGSDMHRIYHQGQIDMLEIFFNIKDKNK